MKTDYKGLENNITPDNAIDNLKQQFDQSKKDDVIKKFKELADKHNFNMTVNGDEITVEAENKTIKIIVVDYAPNISQLIPLMKNENNLCLVVDPLKNSIIEQQLLKKDEYIIQKLEVPDTPFIPKKMNPFSKKTKNHLPRWQKR